MNERHIETIFSDDIRHEVNGKLSYIGVYSTSLYVPSFPCTLPKLCLSVKVVTQAERPISSLTLRVLKDDEIFQEVMVNDQQLKESVEAAIDMANESQNERAQLMQFHVVFSPIIFEGPCVLRVRGQTDDEELRGLALNIELRDSPSVSGSDQLN